MIEFFQDKKLERSLFVLELDQTDTTYLGKVMSLEHCITTNEHLMPILSFLNYRKREVPTLFVLDAFKQNGGVPRIQEETIQYFIDLYIEYPQFLDYHSDLMRTRNAAFTSHLESNNLRYRDEYRAIYLATILDLQNVADMNHLDYESMVQK